MTTTHALETSENIRLLDFEIVNLFDEFTYKIPLRQAEHVTAIIAPNGTGKTLCLRMIHGLFARRWSLFSDSAYDRAIYRFSNSSTVTIRKSKQRNAQDEAAGSESPFEITVRPPAPAEAVTWKPKPADNRRVPTPERYLPFLTRVSGTRWRHDDTGEILPFSDIIETFGEHLPETYRRDVYGKIPPALERIIQSIDCRLIETQRLLILQDQRLPAYIYAGNSGRSSKSTLAIARKAETLKEIVQKEIGSYATLSQSLDRSFPRRAIQRASQIFPPEDLRRQLTDIDEKRQELTEAGILDREADEPVELPAGDLSAEIGGVMSVYAEDTRRKLESLSGILSKIKLFKRLIDQRFITKDVRISRQNGINVTFHGHPVPLEKLSSGEQHQLVLFFELLFEIRQNSLILIDEPELSLHVAWQKKFIGDLMEIITLNRFDVILATHSPQLIGRWNHLVVELGDVHEGESPLPEDL